MAYKVWILKPDGLVEQVIVFGAEGIEFSEEEELMLQGAKGTDDKIKYSPVQIHKDDSVEQLKKKIVNETGANYAEIYTFCYKNVKLNLLNALLSSTKSIIDKPIMDAFLANIDMDGLNIDSDKTVYEYKYLTNHGFNQEYSLAIKTSLGIEFIRQPNYLFAPNPFQQQSKTFEGVENSLAMNETRLIGNIVDNNIYVCMAQNLNESIVRLYYPHLASENIFTDEQLLEAQPLLKSKTDEIMKEGTFSMYKSIDALYSTYETRERELGANKGITEFNIQVVPSFELNMPLDALFKNIHCDEAYPFIKYNPGIRRENLYRLYSTQISKTGKKIPYLSKNKIMSLARTTSTHKQISIFNEPNNLIISVEANGAIGIHGKFDNAKPVTEIEQFIKSAVNPVIDKINNYLLSSGYRISYINKLDDSNIKIAAMNYEFQCPVKKRINLKNACVYSVFDVLESDVRKGGLLRFKRVDNFQKMDALNAFISDYIKKRGNPMDAVDALTKNYGIDTKQAMRLVSDSNVPVNKNPGLVTTMNVENNILTVKVVNLDNILYVETLGIYLDSICRMVQNGIREECNVAEIQAEVSYSTKAEEPVYDINVDINAQIQKILENKQEQEQEGQVYIPGDNLGFDEDEEPVYVPGADLGFDDDDEFEGGDKEKGGNKEKGGDKEKGGEKSDSDDDSGIIGKRFFLKRLMKADPVLFKEVNKKDGKVERYTRACPSMQQPVVISNDEKERIDSINRKSYVEAIQYGSDENKKNNNWYICPRFWCFKPGKYKNTSMTEDDINAGKCGESEAERKKYVFEFNNKKDHIGKDGKYRYFNPSFITKMQSNKNLCLPCCYAEWDSNMHQKRRRQCMEGEEASEQKQTKTTTNEVMAHNKALTPGRWGYLPFSIQYFMQFKYKKDDQIAFLRYGVEKQSFIGCIADVYGRLHKSKTPTIAEMRDMLVKSFTIDEFAKFGNGSFVSTFHNYKKSKQSMPMLQQAYNNFCNYLMNESSIDHTYLWDVVCSPNPKLFKHGLNLIIMDIVNNDITDKVDLLCPSTSYFKNRYDKNRDSLFIISTESKYEPVYLVYGKKDKVVIPVFRTSSEISNITNVLNVIDKTLNKYCSASRKVPQEYFQTFNAPMELQTLLNEIGKVGKQYHAVKQIMNYQNRIIGLTVHTPSGKNIVVYSEPSAPLNDFETVYMDDMSLWHDYETTRDELIELNRANPNILCKPLVKVIDNKQVVGFITETNQFVKLSEPADNQDDGIHSIKEKNHILNNSHQIPLAISEVIEKSKGPDTKREYTVRNIGLESDFFILYRSTVKTLLENREYRNAMVALLDNSDLLYAEKLEKVAEQVKNITENVVQYAKLSDSVLNNMTMIAYTCSDKSTSGIFQQGCQLIVPEKNLVSGKLNSTVYPYRVADELIRFGRIKNYILNSNQFLNMGNTEFKLNQNEYILLESALMNKEYFDDMVPHNSVGIIHDIAKTQLFSPPFVELNKQAEPVHKDNVVCTKVEPHRKAYNDNFWVTSAFPDKLKTMQIEFKDTPECSFGPLRYILSKVRGTEPVSVGEIKTMLWEAYQEYSPAEMKKLLFMLGKQGKSQMIENVAEFETAFKSESYNMTTTDVWVFAEKYELPIILFSSSVYLHDALIIQDSENKQYNKKYNVYKIQKVPEHKLTHSWIQMGSGNEPYWFYQSASEHRGHDKITKNVIIEKAYRADELNEFGKELHARRRVSLKEFLA